MGSWVRPTRAVRAACATALVALALPAAVPAQTAPETLTFTATPARAGGPVTVSLTLKTASRGAPAVDGHAIALEPSARYNGRLFPRCTFGRLVRARTTSVCPTGSIVGSGHAIVFAFRPGPTTRINHQWTMTAINGGDRLFLVWRDPNLPQTRNAVADNGQIQRRGGALFIGWNDPRVVTPFAFTVIEWHLRLGATIRAAGRRRGIIEIGKCPNGRWRAVGIQRYESIEGNGQIIDKPASASTACRSA